ncbi:Recombination, repair and ssDNA binding protein UvsY [compost metagenome]
MNLIELQAKLDADLKIDPSNLMEETSSNLNKHAWYFGQLQKCRGLRMRELGEFKELEKNRYNYYAGIGKEVFDYNLDRTAIKYNLEGDSECLAKQKAISMIDLKIEFFLKACDLMKDRGFAIKNQIDLLKFQNGM